MEQLVRLIEEQNKTWEEFKKVDARRDAELKEFGEALGQTTEAIEKIKTDLIGITDQVAELKAGMERPSLDGEDEEKSKAGSGEYKAAFMSYLRKGYNDLTPEESKTLSEGIDSLGGHLVPSDVANEIIRSVTETSPIRSIATVRTTGRDRYEVPKRTGTFSAVWSGETQTRSETTGLGFGMEEIPVNGLQAMVAVTMDLLEDSAFDLEQFLREEFAEQFASAEGAAFVSGSGNKQPEGFLTNSAVTAAYYANGDTSELQADAIIKLPYQLKDAYGKNAVWVLKRSTIGEVMALKDGNGRYLWNPGGGISGGPPASICGYPYVEAVDMGSVSSGEYPMAIGDFKRGYYIIDRRGITVTRIQDSTTMQSNSVQFWATMRVGGQVVNAEAIKVLKMAAS